MQWPQNTGFICFFLLFYVFILFREETEIIEGEVVEIQIDRPVSGTVSLSIVYYPYFKKVFTFFYINKRKFCLHESFHF